MQTIKVSWTPPSYLSEDIMCYRITGDCMEREGINDGDIIAVDRSRFPIAPTEQTRFICACHGFAEKKPHLPILMAKIYNGRRDGHYTGITAYKDRPDDDIHIVSIEGVVCAVFTPSGELKREFDISRCPTHADRREKKKLPVFSIGGFLNTMEGCCLWNVSKEIYNAASSAFRSLPPDVQHRMMFTPKTNDPAEWHERGEFWAGVLEPSMTAEQLTIAMDAITSWYQHCIALRLT